jgi:hypothetical protein
VNSLYHFSSLVSHVSANLTIPGCSDLSSCDQCFSVPQCQWCLPFSCVDNDGSSCPILLSTSTCPNVTSLQPDHYPVGESVDILVTGGKFISSNQYTCKIGDINCSATWVSDNEIICHASAQQSFSSNAVEVLLSGTLYVASGSTFEFYGV